ncbi:hypothetical protein D3C81_1893750 [compost metagenome]
MVGDDGIGPHTGMVGIAGPRMVEGMCHQPRLHGHAFEVAAASEEEIVGIDDGSFVASLPQCPYTVVFLVEIWHVIASQPLHQLPQARCIAGRGQQM